MGKAILSARLFVFWLLCVCSSALHAHYFTVKSAQDVSGTDELEIYSYRELTCKDIENFLRLHGLFYPLQSICLTKNNNDRYAVSILFKDGKEESEYAHFERMCTASKIARSVFGYIENHTVNADNFSLFEQHLKQLIPLLDEPVVKRVFRERSQIVPFLYKNLDGVTIPPADCWPGMDIPSTKEHVMKLQKFCMDQLVFAARYFDDVKGKKMLPYFFSSAWFCYAHKELLPLVIPAITNNITVDEINSYAVQVKDKLPVKAIFEQLLPHARSTTKQGGVSKMIGSWLTKYHG